MPHFGFKAFSYETIKEAHRFLERLSGLCYKITQLKDTFLLRKPEVNFCKSNLIFTVRVSRK